MTDTVRTTEFDGGTRESLLDVVLDRMQKSGKTVIISRVVYVIRFTKREGNADQQRAFYSKLIDKHLSEGDVTGMLLMYPQCAVHVLEAKTSTINSVLRDVLAAHSADSRIAEARVISSTDDIPGRCFGAWSVAFASSNSSADTMEPVDATVIVKTASDLNSFLRKVGPTLQGLSDHELRKRLGEFEQFYEDVPAPEVLLSMTPAEDAPTLTEYLEIYDSPVNVDLDSEQVWPMPIPLKF